MVSQAAFEPPSIRQDGFGTRQVEETRELGLVERLTLSPPLSTAASELAVRARAAHLTRIDPVPLARVLRVDRTGAGVAILSARPSGVWLSDILAALEFGTLTLSDDEAIELAASIVRAAGQLHSGLGTVAHGAFVPSHVIVRPDATTVFSGAVFGDAIQALTWSRERIWLEFGLALPVTEGAPRFDQRADVAALGALVLAVARRRSLSRDEVPNALNELVAGVGMAPTDQANSRLRTWLRDAMQLHGRAVFDSAVDAARRFGRLLPTSDAARVLALRTAILQVSDRVD